MDELQITQSFVQEDQQNQFLLNDFGYQVCPHCQRNFFLGKLKYHLKLCKSSNPMSKSPIRKNKNSFLIANLGKASTFVQQENSPSPGAILSPQKKYKKCQYCKATFPISMIQRHTQKCNMKAKKQRNNELIPEQKSKTNIDFSFKKQNKETFSALPRIRNSAQQHKKTSRKFVSQDFKETKPLSSVRIREELSCFKKALEVQQIQCSFCNRKFSKQAALRHIPICEKIKNQQLHQIALKKQSKSELHKLNLPVKKSSLLNSKLMGGETNKISQIEVKSARISFSKQLKRQMANNTTVVKVQTQKNSLLQQTPFEKLKESSAENKKVDQAQIRILNEKKQINQSFQHLNMTFSQNFNQSIENDKKPQKKMRTKKYAQIQQQSAEFVHMNSEVSERIYSVPNNEEEASNEFLNVSPSKFKFFNDVDVLQKEQIQQKAPNTKLSLLKSIKLQID